MTTGYESTFYREFSVLVENMRAIERSLNIIANCMQAAEKRARNEDAMTGKCSQPDCGQPAIVEINGHGYCPIHIDGGFIAEFAGVKKAISAAREANDKEERDASEH